MGIEDLDHLVSTRPGYGSRLAIETNTGHIIRVLTHTAHFFAVGHLIYAQRAISTCRGDELAIWAKGNAQNDVGACIEHTNELAGAWVKGFEFAILARSAAADGEQGAIGAIGQALRLLGDVLDTP